MSFDQLGLRAELLTAVKALEFNGGRPLKGGSREKTPLQAKK